MTRKDYIAIAGVLTTISDAGERERIAMALCGIMQRDNAAFRPGRFLTACNVVLVTRDKDGFTAVLRQ